MELFERLDARILAAPVGERSHPFVPYSGTVGNFAQGSLAALIEELFRAVEQGFCRVGRLLHARECSLRHSMVATAYTTVPLPSLAMGNGLHKTESKRASSEPKDVLARNLRAAFKARGLSARSVADAIGVSNKTVSNMLNGEGASQLDKLVAVAKEIKIPLWQLLCPSLEISQGTAEAMHELLESFVHLSQVGQAAVKRTIKGELALAKNDQPSGPDKA